MALGKGQSGLLLSLAASVAICTVMMPCNSDAAEGQSLWWVYEQTLKGAKYVDLTHTITPNIPVWAGFAESSFAPAKAGSEIEGFAKKGDVYTYAKHGFEATEYTLRTDQLGTQLDPPGHWAPEYPAIDELPATYAIRPLVVVSIVEQLKANPNYALQVADIEAWEQKHGRIPEGSVVFVRSDWSKAWPDPKLATLKEFPGVGLEALKFLHNERKILFHGHEPLDTDSTPDLEGEQWLMHNGYTQAEGVASIRSRKPVRWSSLAIRSSQAVSAAMRVT
jgi:kynurenine formamidase